MGVIQINGKLEKLNLKQAHACIRISGETRFVSIADRGVIEGDTIRRCTEEERRKPLTPGSLVRIDIDDGSIGEKTVIAWAPK